MERYVLWLFLCGVVQKPAMALNVEKLAGLIENLVRTQEGSDLTIISDFTEPDQTQIVELLSKRRIPASVYDPRDLQRKIEDRKNSELCPIFVDSYPKGGKNVKVPLSTKEEFVPQEAFYQRKDILSIGKSQPIFFIWVKDDEIMGSFLLALNHTVMNCKQNIDPGIFRPHASFVFFASRGKAIMDYGMKVFSIKEFRLSARVAIVEHLRESGEFAFYAYNFLQTDATKNYDSSALKLRLVWNPQRPINNLEEITTPQKDFRERVFVVSTLPYAGNVRGSRVPANSTEWAPDKQFSDFWGYEYYMLEAVCEVLRCKFVVRNPPDQMWGSIKAGLTFAGLIGDAAYGMADFAFSDLFLTYERHRVTDSAVMFDSDYSALASPMPSPLPKFVAIVKPFQPAVWTGLALIVVVAAFAYPLIASGENRVSQNELPIQNWSSFKEAVWFCFATIMYQSCGASEMSPRAIALRYSGSLMACLTIPGYTSTVNTLSGVLASGLPWHMVLYGEAFQQAMATSKNPVVREIWQGKIVTSYAQQPNLSDVRSGKSIFIDYKSGLEAAVKSVYSTSSGAPLVHLSFANLSEMFPTTWHFPKINPWKERFNEVILRFQEAGLVQKWKSMTWARLREKLDNDGPPLWQPHPAPLTVHHLQAIAYPCAGMIVLAIAVAVLETVLSYRQCSRGQRGQKYGEASK